MYNKNFWIKMIFLGIMLAVIAAIVTSSARHKVQPEMQPNPSAETFFDQFVIAGGPIVWFALLPLSFIMVSLAVEYSLTIRREKLLPPGIASQIIEVIEKFGVTQAVARISDRHDLVSNATIKTLTQGKGDWLRMRSLLAESLQDQALALLRKIEWII